MHRRATDCVPQPSGSCRRHSNQPGQQIRSNRVVETIPNHTVRHSWRPSKHAAAFTQLIRNTTRQTTSTSCSNPHEHTTKATTTVQQHDVHCTHARNAASPKDARPLTPSPRASVTAQIAPKRGSGRVDDWMTYSRSQQRSMRAMAMSTALEARSSSEEAGSQAPELLAR